ncbi:hypothetical protein GJ698_12435 [Pseudoduganella sp. FT26W]|uniref:Uncharacterized protein n=1 Tax=Duganella aquatilis TaxID=2666082 RepID=A0A844DBN2_9BURK|nr:hypothetical protein [Duganella aquatilis]MRW84889.1 hypothetical protein [Duganella aquatilis]
MAELELGQGRRVGAGWRHQAAQGPGQSLSVKILADGKAIESNYVIQPKAKNWAVVVVPLKEPAADNKTIDGLWVQGAAASYKPYYITHIQFE